MRRITRDRRGTTCTAVVGLGHTAHLDAGFTHFHALSGAVTDSPWTTEPRRAYNNVFVAAYPDPGLSEPVAFLPPDWFDGRSDGNLHS